MSGTWGAVRNPDCEYGRAALARKPIDEAINRAWYPDLFPSREDQSCFVDGRFVHACGALKSKRDLQVSGQPCVNAAEEIEPIA
jgi:hypothetical protein